MKMKNWPQKKDPESKDTDKVSYCCGYNQALDDCRAVIDKQPKLVMNENMLRKIATALCDCTLTPVQYMYYQNVIDKVAKEIIAKFGTEQREKGKG